MAYLIACDDGHGMETAGKRTPALPYDIKFNGRIRKKGEVIHENEFNECIMKKFIEGCKRVGINTFEVAPTTKDTSLKARVNLANQKNAKLYISFHANALGSKWQTKAYGLVVIKHAICSSTTNKLAQNVYKYLSTGVDWYSNGGTKYGVRKDQDISGCSLYVLKNTKMPAILCEYGFMDNIEDVKRMCTDKFIKDCAENTLKGVCETLGVKYVAPVTSNSNSTNSSKWVNGDYNCKVKTTANLNLRSGRGTSYDVIKTVPKGTILTLGYVLNGWGSTWDYKNNTSPTYFSCDYVEKV